MFGRAEAMLHGNIKALVACSQGSHIKRAA